MQQIFAFILLCIALCSFFFPRKIGYARWCAQKYYRPMRREVATIQSIMWNTDGSFSAKANVSSVQKNIVLDIPSDLLKQISRAVQGQGDKQVALMHYQINGTDYFEFSPSNILAAENNKYDTKKNVLQSRAHETTISNRIQVSRKGGMVFFLLAALSVWSYPTCATLACVVVICNNIINVPFLILQKCKQKCIIVTNDGVHLSEQQAEDISACSKKDMTEDAKYIFFIKRKLAEANVSGDEFICDNDCEECVESNDADIPVVSDSGAFDFSAFKRPPKGKKLNNTTAKNDSVESTNYIQTTMVEQPRPVGGNLNANISPPQEPFSPMEVMGSPRDTKWIDADDIDGAAECIEVVTMETLFANEKRRDYSDIDDEVIDVEVRENF